MSDPTLVSRGDPKRAGERLAQALQITPRTLYLCVSPLDGYGLKKLLETMQSDSGILCVEADDALFDISKREIPSDVTLHKKF
jgi:hypothetical protein